MNKTIAESLEFVNRLLPKLPQAQSKVMIATSFTSLSRLAQRIENSPIQVGAQNFSEHEEGPFTGEVSLRMIQEAGAQFSLIGHSERRIHLNETEEQIHQKIKKACEKEFPVILCIGENLKQKENGSSFSVIKRQLMTALGNLSAQNLKNMMIAYEPVWAIGTGNVAGPQLVQESHFFVRDCISQMHGGALATKIPILYGGSLNPNNLRSILQQPDVNGALIGGASLDIDSFINMVQL